MKEGRQGVRGRCPGMMQITKTEETDFEEFKKEHIQLVNDDWTTPLSTTRSDTIIITLSLCTILTLKETCIQR